MKNYVREQYKMFEIQANFENLRQVIAHILHTAVAAEKGIIQLPI